MKNRILVFGFLILALGIITISVRSQPEPKVSTKDVMKFKLLHAQRVLEGIATENFEVIAENAKQLKLLSQQANWQIRQTPEYQRFTTDFARTADALSKAAENKNVDAATIAYFQMTVTCTTCHKYLRGEKAIGATENPDADLIAFLEKSKSK